MQILHCNIFHFFEICALQILEMFVYKHTETKIPFNKNRNLGLRLQNLKDIIFT